jgi:hypothetical protein
MGIRTRWRILNSVSFAILAATLLSSAHAAERVFVLEIANRGLVCGYTSEHEWAQVPKEKDVEFTAMVDSADGVVAAVLVQRYTEDTTTYDEYAVSKDGNIRRLKRILDVIPERVSREQIWDIRGGQAFKVSELWMEFKTHKPRGPDKDLDDLVETPIIVRISDFPFNLLITDKHPERWTGGVRCVPGSMNKLEAASPK